MTSPSPMSREDLLELAMLDAIGLLDEYEADLYTRAFHHAPATVQDEIREKQATIAADSALLPDVTPRQELREKTLAAMSAAAEAASAPIASIGASAARQAGGHRLSNGTDGSGSWYRAWNSATMWRAASFALVGALVVVSYFALQFHERNNAIADIAMGRNVQQKLAAEMSDEAYRKYLVPSTQKVALTGVDGRDDLHGVVLLHDDGEAYLIVFGQLDNPVTLEWAEGSKTFTSAAELATTSLGKLSETLIASIASAGFSLKDSVTGVMLLRQA